LDHQLFHIVRFQSIIFGGYQLHQMFPSSFNLLVS